MDLQKLAALVGLSPDHCMSLLKRIYAFETSLTPVELAAVEKLISEAYTMSAAKRQEVEDFLASQVANPQSGPMAGVCFQRNP